MGRGKRKGGRGEGGAMAIWPYGTDSEFDIAVHTLQYIHTYSTYIRHGKIGDRCGPWGCRLYRLYRLYRL